jgi:hypothetical protein
VPSIIESSALHMSRSNEVVVFAGFSVNVNSETSILRRCVYDDSKEFGGRSVKVSYKRSRTIAAGAFKC